jgi:hypothetical protein
LEIQIRRGCEGVAKGLNFQNILENIFYDTICITKYIPEGVKGLKGLKTESRINPENCPENIRTISSILLRFG